MDNITKQFTTAIRAITETGVSLRTLCETTGIDRRNLTRVMKAPANNHPRPQWLALVCQHYRVSPDFLLLGQGNPLR